MKIIKSIEEIPKLEGPIALSIGIFDGVHLGHQAILSRLRKLTRKKGSRVLLTFSNHPSTLFTPNSPTAQITSLEKRLDLLRGCDLDLVIVLPFTQEIANLSYDAFFALLRTYLAFDYLIVGEDARFGKDRAGSPEKICKLGWKTEYLAKQTHHKEVISSDTIRKALQQRQLKKVHKMLGRPYSISLFFDQASVVKEDEVQYKWATGAEKLCLLPSAVYAVDLVSNGKSVPAIAFYRGAQRITGDTHLLLTIYFEKDLLESGQIEVVFVSYLHDMLNCDFEVSKKTRLLESLKPEFFPS